MVQMLREGEPSIEVGPGSRQQLQIGVWMMEPVKTQSSASGFARSSPARKTTSTTP